MAVMERDLVRQDAATLARAMSDGEVSSEEVTRAHLDRIASVDERVHAFLHVMPERALAQARDVDRRRAGGERLGPLGKASPIAQLKSSTGGGQS